MNALLFPAPAETSGGMVGAYRSHLDRTVREAIERVTKVLDGRVDEDELREAIEDIANGDPGDRAVSAIYWALHYSESWLDHGGLICEEVDLVRIAWHRLARAERRGL